MTRRESCPGFSTSILAVPLCRESRAEPLGNWKNGSGELQRSQARPAERTRNMLRRKMEMSGIMLFVGLLMVAPLRAGQDQGNGSNPPEVRASIEAKPSFNAQPADARSFQSLANGPSDSAQWLGFIRNQPPES